MGEGMQIIRKRSVGRGWIGLVVLSGLLLPICVEAGVPVLSSQRVTDVTTRSFAVILTVSEPATPLLSLFAPDCITPATGFTTTTQQSPSSGNLRITVSGLNAATGYCYQLAVTSTATAELTTSNATAVTTAAAIVRTRTSEADLVPSANDILKVPAVHLAGGEARDTIIATVELSDGSALSPLSLLLAADPNKDYFNLNNLFAASTGKTFRPAGNERVRLTENHGSSGCVIDRFRTLPAQSGGIAPRAFVRANTHDIDASGGVNVLDVLRVVGGKGTTSTDPCFNSDLDLNVDGAIDAADLTTIKGGFNGLP